MSRLRTFAMISPRVEDILIPLLLTLGAVAVFCAVWKFRTRRGRGRRETELRILQQSRMTAELWVLLFLCSLLPPSPHASWKYIVAGVILGAVIGAVLARRRITGWERDLQATGRLAPENGSWWQSWPGALLFMLLSIPALGWGLLNLTASPGYVGGTILAGFDALCGLTAVLEGRKAWWVYRKERSGSAPLVITARRV